MELKSISRNFKHSGLSAALTCAVGLALVPAADATVHTFTVYMDGEAMIPPNASTGFGFATVTLDDVTGSITVSGGYLGMAGDVFDANIHGYDFRCADMPEVLSLAHTGGTTGTIVGSAFLPPGDVFKVLEGLAYLSYKSTAFPAGEVRGQLMNGELFCDACDSALGACFCGGGDPDSGCEIAQSTGGVKLRAPVWSPDGFGGGTVTLTGTGFPSMSSPTAIVIRATSKEPAAVNFGDGLRCLGLPVMRMGSTSAIGGTSTHTLSHGAGSGFFYYQLWFRNTPSGFCTPAAFNLSNGLELAW